MSRPPTAIADSDPSMWTAAHGYETFMGRWSRRVAVRFLNDLHVPPARRWLDVGCGTGALTTVIAGRCAPSSIVGVDPSPSFLALARERLRDTPETRFEAGDAENLLFPDGAFDATVTGLTLNFVADAQRALAEMCRVTRPEGIVAGYVWDYDHPGFFLTRFWDAIAQVHGHRLPDDERGRWELCSLSGLAKLAAASPLRDRRVWTIDVDTVFADLDQLWHGFLLGVGPSGSYPLALSADRRDEVRAHLQASLPVAADGRVRLTGRALAVVGTRP
ncbi:MAG: methyltransferase domain-containing protein [Actinomycetota bacterium]|nr:methyltransferase domain-containing protein [Actinomycetota bacterium]